MNKEIIATYTYELPLPNDEEIRNIFKEAGVSNVNPEMVRTYIRQCIYDMFCNAENENNIKV